MKKFKISNVTNLATGSRGFFLDLGAANGGRHIGVGKHIVLEANSLEVLPEGVLKWANKNWVKIHEMGSEDMQVAGLPASQELTPSAINPISELKDDDISNEEPSLSDAHEAKLINNEHTGPIEQDVTKTARISDAMAEERHSLDISPIPGDQPKELGDASKFTVKAPRSKHQGSIVKP